MYSYVKTTNIQTLFLVCFLNVSTQQEIKRLDLYEGTSIRYNYILFMGDKNVIITQ